jgi:hypothetical protein
MPNKLAMDTPIYPLKLADLQELEKFPQRLRTPSIPGQLLAWLHIRRRCHDEFSLCVVHAAIERGFTHFHRFILSINHP